MLCINLTYWKSGIDREIPEKLTEELTEKNRARCVRKKTSQLSCAGSGFGPTRKVPEVRTEECFSSNGLLFLDDVGKENAKAVVLQSKRVWRSAKTAMSSLGCLSSPEPDSVLSAGWDRREHQNQMWDPTRSGSGRIRNNTLLLADDSPAATVDQPKPEETSQPGDFKWVSYKYNTKGKRPLSTGACSSCKHAYVCQALADQRCNLRGCLFCLSCSICLEPQKLWRGRKCCLSNTRKAFLQLIHFKWSHTSYNHIKLP